MPIENCVRIDCARRLFTTAKDIMDLRYAEDTDTGEIDSNRHNEPSHNSLERRT